MSTVTTNGIKVVAKTNYLSAYSSPIQHHYVFTYEFVIENLSKNTIQLLQRKWKIHDLGSLTKNIVEEGISGKTPILEPQQTFEYVSGCNLKSGIGKIEGVILVEDLNSNKYQEILIPEFCLTVPYKLN